MVSQISLLTKPQNNAFLNPIAPYVKNIETIKHGNGFGTTNGTQINIIKMLGDNGGCDVILTPHSGQNLIAGFSTKKSAINEWITSHGSTTTDVIIDSANSGASKTISILNPINDQYIWFAVAVDGYLGVSTPNINDTYTLELSGNYSSPESLLLTASTPIATPGGFFDNPVLIQPNESGNQYNAQFGECLEGSYYFTFIVSAYISRFLTFTPDSFQNFGIIISSNKNELKSWILNGGVGTLTDGGSYQNSNELPLDIEISLTTSKTMYAVYYNPLNIGVNSCNSEKLFTITSSQETQSSSNSGTYANPFIISNNLDLYNAVTQYRNMGQCKNGAIYYEILPCYGSVLSVIVQSSFNFGIGYSTSKDSLAAFLLTSNYSNLLGYAENHSGSETNLVINGPSPVTFYFILYDPNNIGINSCSQNDAFVITTSQKNCAGINDGRDGTFENPYLQTNIDILHTAGDCQNGMVWYELPNNCGNAPYTFTIDQSSYQALKLTWGNDKQLVYDYLITEGGTGYIPCAQEYFYDNYNPSNSNYVDNLGNVYYNSGTDAWYISIPHYYSVITDLPDYMNGGSFVDPDNEYTSDYYDAFGNYYANQGYESWIYYQVNYIYGISNLPEYCYQNPGVYEGIISRDFNGYFSEIFSGLNIGTLYAVISVSPIRDTCSDNSTFNLNYSRGRCEDFLPNGDGQVKGLHTNPFVISNNGSYNFYDSSGLCNLGSIFYQILLCGTQFTFELNSTIPRGIAWSKSVSALNNWVQNGGTGDLSFDGGSISTTETNGLTLTFTPNLSESSEVYYFVVYASNYFESQCESISQTYITTTQLSCDGEDNIIGTYESPLVIGNNDLVTIKENLGNCFTGVTYFSMQLCASESSTSFTLSKSSIDNPQIVFYSNNLDITKMMVDYYVIYQTTVSWGGYYKEGYNLNVENATNPLTTTILASTTQTTIFIAIIDGPTPGIPRCSRSGDMTVSSSQYCPTINIGGTSDISGGARYNYDPYAPASISKHGVTLTTGDIGKNYFTSLYYFPTLVIDNASQYPPITCENISVSLYVNDVDGVTSYVSTQNITSDIDIIYDKNLQSNGDMLDYAFIKPLPSKELLFDNVSLYTGLLRVTYDTNIGRFIRNQVVNSGDSFTNGRKQFAYLLSQNNEKLNILLPVADEDVHSLATENTCLSPSFTKNNGNIFQTNTLIVLSGGDSISFPFKINNDLGYKNAHVHIPNPIVSSIIGTISGGSDGISGGSGTISGGSDGISGGSGTISGGSDGISGVIELFKPKTITITDGIYPNTTSLQFYDSDASYSGQSSVYDSHYAPLPYTTGYSFGATTGNTYVTFDVSVGPGPSGSVFEGQYLNFTRTTKLPSVSDSFYVGGWRFATIEEARSVPYTISWIRTDPTIDIPDIKYLSQSNVSLWVSREYLYYNNMSKSYIILEKSTNPAIGTLTGSIDTTFTVDRIRVDYYNKNYQYMVIEIRSLEGYNYFTQVIYIDIPYNAPPNYFKNYQTNTIPISINNIQYSKGLILTISVSTSSIYSDASLVGQAFFKNLVLT